MNIATDPWLPVWTNAGHTDTVSLRDAFARASTIAAVRFPDPVHTAAAHRLLIAVDSAAHDANDDPADWIDEHAARFDLFDDVAPFGQSADLRTHPEAWKPAVALCLSAAGDQAVFIDHRHSSSGSTLTPTEAVPELLGRLAFTPGGIQPFPAAPYGPDAKNGKRSVLTGKAFVWIEGPTLADTLTVNRVSGGTFHFTWPGEWTPGETQRCDGPIAALTWPSRAIIVDTEGTGDITRVMVANGAVFDDNTPQMLPHSLWHPDKDGALAPVSVSTSALTWLRTLEAWAPTGKTPLFDQRVGILATAANLPEQQRRTHTIHVAGLATFQSRIDGPIEATVPIPQVNQETVAALCAQTRKLAPTLNGRITTALTRTDTVMDDEWVQHCVDSALIGLRADMADHVNQVITGRRPFHDEIPAALVATRLQPTVQHLRNIGHPRAAAYLAAATTDAISTPAQPNLPLPARTGPTTTTPAAEAFVTATLAARYRHDRNLLSAFAEWTPGTISQPVAAATADAPDDTWEVWAQVGRLICTHPNPDGPAISPTRWLQQVRDVETDPTWAALCATLNSTSLSQRPAWAALIEELTRWHDPTTRRASVNNWTTDRVDQTA